MHKKFSLLVAMFAMIIVLVFMVTSPAIGSNKDVRVWVEYKPGQSVQVRNSLNGYGAQIHYQFDQLNSFVVSLPEQALTQVAGNPRVLNIEFDEDRFLIEPKPITIQDMPDPNNEGQTIPFGIDAVQ
ncbi:MAG: hypothetical protein GWN30_08900, partial [Gammaproteobacteria bacterium]|nr:hypothetical protein [Gammaproteobacteria bacterium]